MRHLWKILAFRHNISRTDATPIYCYCLLCCFSGSKDGHFKQRKEGIGEKRTLPVLKGNVYFCTLNSLPCYFSIIGNKASFSRPKFHVKRQGRVDVPNAALSLSVELICPPKIDANRLSVWLASQINNNLLPAQLQVIRTPQNAAQNQAFDVCQGPSPI